MGRLTAGQEIAVASATMVGAALSIVGSLFIIVNILIKKKHKDGTYHRLLLGLCAMDVIGSSGWMMTPFSAPSESSHRELALGTTNTCAAQGFIVQIQSGFVLYNGCLALHYLLTTRYGMLTKRVTRRECIMHSVCWVWAVGSAFVPLPFGLYNELGVGSGCWIGQKTSQTSGLQGNSDSARALVLRYLLGALPCAVALGLVIVCNTLLYRLVRKTEESSQRFSITAATTETLSRTKIIASQATWYVVIFWNCLFWQALLKILSGSAQVITAENESSWVALILMAQFFSASAGFGFVLVYFRPRYMRSRRRNFLPWTALAVALFMKKRKSPNGELRRSAVEAPDWDESRFENESKIEEALGESTAPRIVEENEIVGLES